MSRRKRTIMMVKWLHKHRYYVAWRRGKFQLEHCSKCPMARIRIG